MRLDELLLLMESRGGCLISIEPVHELFTSSARLRLSNYKHLHNHSFCRYIKGLDGNRSCAVNKHRSMRIATCGHRFCGFCPYGVWEVVQPVMFHGKLAAIIYLGDFMEASRREELMRKNPAISEILPETLDLTRQKAFKETARFLADFIQCELELVSSIQSGNEKQHSQEYYCKLVLDMIALRYHEDIQLKDAAAICNLNPNYLSGVLQRGMGRSFRQLLTEQRLAEAEACLKYHRLSIAEIAEKCGFRDSNYFSVVFSKYRGITPSEYRSTWRTAEREMMIKKRSSGKIHSA